MNRRSFLAALPLLLLAAGCATASLTPAQQQWIAARDQQPLSFAVSAEETEAAWSRAQQWIVRHGEQPLTVATDSLLQTATGHADFEASVSLTVTRSVQPDGSYLFEVVARTGNPLSTSRTWNAARALAYYAASGVPYP
jgi:hypothetical protein